MVARPEGVLGSHKPLVSNKLNNQTHWIRAMADPTPKAIKSQLKKIKPHLMRLFLVLVLAVVAATFYVFGLDRFLTFESLAENRETLVEILASHRVSGVIVYIAFYATAVTLFVPGALVLTVAGGFIFGPWYGTLYVVLGATIGATGNFMIAKPLLRNTLRDRAGSTLRKMEAGFQENAINYLLTLRLIPVFPFYLVNVIPALLGVSLRTYLLGTFVGIIPGSFVYANIGVGLDSIFEKNKEISIHGVLTLEIIAALIGLALLAILPAAYQKIKNSKRKGSL